nr:hypothetical protein [uncultured Albidiferax sp.]
MTTASDEQLKIRPVIRVLAAGLMMLIALLMVFNSIPYFSAETITLKSCVEEHKASSKLLCEIGNKILSSLPVRMQGPAEGVTHFAVAALLVYLSWLLVRPIPRKTTGETS